MIHPAQQSLRRLGQVLRGAAVRNANAAVIGHGRTGAELFDLCCDVRETVTRALEQNPAGSLNRRRIVLETLEMT
jgi:hypothetical protein